ncbi:hypothetical protein RRG08_049568, partial [Elysia crispata]
ICIYRVVRASGVSLARDNGNTHRRTMPLTPCRIRLCLLTGSARDTSGQVRYPGD